MKRARCIVCEPGNRWAVALRWALTGSSIRVYETRNWEDCWLELTASPASIVMLEFYDGNASMVGGWLLDVRSRFPHARVIAMARAVDQPALWLARELGAVHAVSSIRNLTATGNLVRRHLQQVAAVEEGFRQQVWSRMPWTEDA